MKLISAEILLHDNALKRLIQKLYEIATDRHLQIIFTTHSVLMMDLKDFVCIRYLIQTPEATLCQTSISTDSILQLTGEQHRPIHIYVEDELSKTIITQICSELNCKRFVNVFIFGPAVNAFTVIAGKVLNNEDTGKTLAVLDGDVYKTQDEKEHRIQAVITGQGLDEKRAQVLSCISQYNLPEGQKPELFIRNSILALSDAILPSYDEFRIVLNEIGIVDDDHKYIDDAIERLDLDYKVGLSTVVKWFAKTEYWETYTLPVRTWIEAALQEI